VERLVAWIPEARLSRNSWALRLWLLLCVRVSVVSALDITGSPGAQRLSPLLSHLHFPSCLFILIQLLTLDPLYSRSLCHSRHSTAATPSGMWLIVSLIRFHVVTAVSSFLHRRPTFFFSVIPSLSLFLFHLTFLHTTLIVQSDTSSTDPHTLPDMSDMSLSLLMILSFSPDCLVDC
jgi:hypothetical protein